LQLDAFFSFKMPETYINLPGFKLDTPESEKSKIDVVKEQLPKVIVSISKREQGNFDELKGGAPFLKSYILKPLFYGLLISDKPFNVNDSCNGCGKCAKECPLHNINMVDGKPRWNGNCTNCMSCYHRCPNNAINFGKQTCGKGQYYFKK
jgi:ferredoxin